MALDITFTKFVDWFPTRFPSWMRQKWGRRLGEAFGIWLDGMMQGANDALRARLINFAPVDALAYIGEERGLERFPAETPDAYRARLIKAWDTWHNAGTAAGIVEVLRQAGYTAIVHESKKDVELRANTWDRPDHNPARWAHFWVEIDQPHGFGTSSWSVGDGTLVGGGVVVGFDGAASSVIPRLNLIRRIVAKWKASHAKCDEIVVVLSGRLVGDFTVGDGVVGGDARYVSPAIDPSF